MKTTIFKISIAFMVAVFFTSCSTIQITYYGTKDLQPKKIVLVSTMIDKVQQSPLPLLDAAFFNPKVNKIADEISSMEQKNVNTVRDKLGQCLQNSFKCKVLYGDSLYNSAVYAQLKEKYNYKKALSTENENFPFIILPKNQINPFLFEKANVSGFFSEESKLYTKPIADIAGIFDADYVAVSNTYFATGAGSFGAYGYCVGVTRLYLFDRRGNLISVSSNNTKNQTISGSNLEEFNAIFDLIPDTFEPMMTKLMEKFSTSTIQP